ncbi:hypothetical protein LIER_34179 [Lithospermum erythrorhizon]|uniref:Uncharacterized protein n=1 Tax=Lithospermum erythrorhizon TaxID=34254 RepID=A0AAV3RYS3_LITER
MKDLEAGLLGAKPVHFLMEQNHRLGSSTIHVLSQFLHEAHQDHWSTAICVVKYLKEEKTQTIVSHSSTEAEYKSMAAVACELNWLKGFLHCLDVDHSQPMDLKCDSQPALYLAQNPVFHERTEYIKVDCHFLRDAALDGTISTTHVSTTNQLVDIFIKALGKRQFKFLLGNLGIYDLHAPT